MKKTNHTDCNKEVTANTEIAQVQPATLPPMKQAKDSHGNSITMLPINSFELDDSAGGIFLKKSTVIEAIRKSMKEIGFRYDKPLILGRINDKLILGDGYTRYFVAKELKIKKVPVMIKECQNYEEFFREIVIGEQVNRRNLATMDKIYAVKILLPMETQAAEKRREKGIASEEAKVGKVSEIIADTLKISRSTTEKIIKILKFDNFKMLEMLDKEEITINKAYNEIMEKERSISISVTDENAAPDKEEPAIIPEVVEELPLEFDGHHGHEKAAPCNTEISAVTNPCMTETDDEGLIEIPVKLFKFLVTTCNDQTKLLSFCKEECNLPKSITAHLDIPLLTA